MINVKWIEALESGEYKQGYEHLHAEGRYCCLGVGELLFAKNNDCDPIWRSLSGVGLPSYYTMDWLGIDDDLAERLIDMNDTQERTFKEIAAYLRSLNDSQTTLA